MRFLLTFIFIFTDRNHIFWVRQMFGVIEQKLNEKTIQMVEFKREQTADKDEFKKKTCGPNGWISNHIIKIKNLINFNYNTSFSDRISNFCFYIHHRTKVDISEIIYILWGKKFSHGISKFGLNFKWISPIFRNETSFFTSIINWKLKFWIKCRHGLKQWRHGKKNSVQRFFDQLILVYDIFPWIKVAAKKLYKMKQKNEQPFSTFISGFEKKMLKTGGMDFNDQITKTLFNNVLNNEMQKYFIGFFITAI